MSNRASIIESTVATLQDQGRLRGSWWGIATNGALDQFSYHYSNALVGNQSNLPCLETALGDLSVQFAQDAVVAVTGAVADVTVGQHPARMNQATVVPAGWPLSVRNLRGGLRSYISVLGGFRGEELFLESVSPDRTLGFGTDLKPGVSIGCGPETAPTVSAREFPFPVLSPPSRPELNAGILGVLPGENQDLFEGHAEVLFESEYVMTDKFDAVGSRLNGPVPRRLKSEEILSRALPIGSIEVAGDELLILNRGRGLSAGYPVVGVIGATSMNALSQTTPGSTVRFVPLKLETARRHRLWEDEVLTATRERMVRILASLLSGGI